jgi:hypothetical protein
MLPKGKKSKWIMNLNERIKMIKLLEEVEGKIFIVFVWTILS